MRRRILSAAVIAVAVTALFLQSCATATDYIDTLKHILNNKSINSTQIEIDVSGFSKVQQTDETNAPETIVPDTTMSDTTIPDTSIPVLPGDEKTPVRVRFTDTDEHVRVSAYYLNLRTSPDTEQDNVFVTVVTNTELRRIGISDDGIWSRVEYKGNILYASNKYLINAAETTSLPSDEKVPVTTGLPMVNLLDSYTVNVGEEFSFETAEFVTGITPGMYFKFAFDGGKLACNSYSATIIPDKCGISVFTFTVMKKSADGNDEKVCEYKTLIRAVEKTEKKLTGLVIGDSRISDGNIVETLLSYYGNDIELLGSVVFGTNTRKRCEGRGGWTSLNYLSDDIVYMYDSKGEMLAGYPKTNPFYNPGTRSFDFGYYLDKMGYECPDFVVINLGANDGYSEESAENVNKMVGNILGFCEKTGNRTAVLVMTEYLRQDADYIYRADSVTGRQFDLFGKQKELFAGRENEGVYLLPNYICINSVSDRRDNDKVHLSSSGYKREALVICAYINGIFGENR